MSVKKRLSVATMGHTVFLKEGGGAAPSTLVQGVTWGERGRYERHFRPELLNPGSEAAILGGAQMVCDAMASHLTDIGTDEVSSVIFVGGVPPKMTELEGFHPSITEAGVMAAYFGERLPSGVGFPIEIVGGTKTTEDDMRQILTAANDCDRLDLFMASWRLPRACALLAKCAQAYNMLDAFRRIVPVAAELSLDAGYGDNTGMLSQIPGSRVLRATMDGEMFGLGRLVAGDYVVGGTS